MVIALVVIALLVALAAASLLGLTADSRDADSGVGPVIAHRPKLS
jgi:Tfp pilus assembly protein FimT